MASSTDSSEFHSAARIPVEWAAAALAILGLGIVMGANGGEQSDTRSQFVALFLGLACLIQAPISSRLDGAGRRSGRWLIIVILVTIIWWGNGFWRLPGFLALLCIPTALASALIGPLAASATALAGTGLLLALSGGDAAAMATPLITIWATLLVMLAAQRPASELVEQSWQYYVHARTWLEEERDRKLEHEQTVADLADANRQLTRLNITARDLRQLAEEARAAKEQFVANVSHELRTPLNMIIGFSELILQAPKAYGRKIPPALLADLVVIKRNAEHLADLVDDVLDLSQVESEQMALAKEYASLGDIIERAAIAVKPLFDSKQLFLEVDVPTELPPILCDPTRIREVVLNLLSNAGRFTESGGVHVRARREGNDVTVAVSDSGPGISPEDMSKLFQPFQQLDSSIRRRFGGTGLGLNISKRFIELHEGKIWAESTLGAGTTFFFRLPVTEQPAARGGFARWMNPEWEFRQRTRPSRAPLPQVLSRLIIVDPTRALARLLGRYLHESEILVVASLEQALEESERTPPQMLVVNGHSVGDSLGSLYASRGLPDGVPVMICSVPGVMEASAALGASDYLVKPISMEALLKALDRMNVREGTVLIVDDEPDARQLFRRMLLSSGRAYRVLMAQDGQEAVAVCREYTPDVILLDLILPNMDGFQLLRVREEHEALRSIPVILISARDPLGQPIVSDAIAITGKGGLSARHLLELIRFLSRTYAGQESPAVVEPPATPPG